jgi:D-threo-aldose 1-dehydrogenase
MNPLDIVQIGTTGLEVTRLGIGGVGLGGVSEEEAVAIIHRSLDMGVRYYDTAPVYGRGFSEQRVGSVLSRLPASSYTISTKVGRLLQPVAPEFVGKMPGPGSQEVEPVFNFTYDGVMRSFSESLQRLGLDGVDILLIHDPDDYYDQAFEGAYKALADLRSQGIITALGAGMNQWEMEARFAREGFFDCFLLAGRYTLLDHSALPDFLPLCQEKNISVIIGGPYNSGILASDLTETATFNYVPAQPNVLEQARRCKTVCDRHGVPLKAAALQFVLAHPAVTSVIPGPRSVAEAEENFRMIEHPTPAALWQELREEGLIPQAAPRPT